MDIVLKSPNTQCAVSGRAFETGDRVVSMLHRQADGQFARMDVLAAEAGGMAPIEGEVLCRWVRTFKPKAQDAQTAAREMRLSLESLFQSLFEEEPIAPENHDLARFLALFLERKRILRPAKVPPVAGFTAYEHARDKRVFQVPAGELDVAFFVRMQDKLGMLLGGNG
jgi:hypothetical protein